MRPIAAGEEVTLSYVEVLQTAENRQQELQAKYSFTCQCNWCALSAKNRKLSDVRRKNIAIALNVSNSWRDGKIASSGSTADPALIFKTVLDSGILDIVKQEGLEYSLGNLAASLAMAYNSLGKMEEFKKWKDLSDIYLGEERPSESPLSLNDQILRRPNTEKH